MTLLSEIVWLALGLIVLGFELVGVFSEKRWGVLPLTRILRDRLMRKHAIVKVALLAGWTWLGYHFFLEGS